MSKEPFKNRYCPDCLSAVDPENGDHWVPCGYEASLQDCINPIQPLTELEMLNRSMADIKEKKERYSKLCCQMDELLDTTQARIIGLRAVIN
jgi:hypothetical protein